MTRFRDRADAGRVLARELARYRADPQVVVLALPRGGVPVGFELAQALGAPLDVFVVRKLGAPGQPELAVGAIASGGTLVVNEQVVRELGIARVAVERRAAAEREELARQERTYRDGHPAIDVEGRTVVLVDDGLATGASMRAAVLALRERHPRRIVVAVPVAAREICADLRRVADEVVCASTPDPFLAVGAWYEDFAQTTDDEVRELLATDSRRSTR